MSSSFNIPLHLTPSRPTAYTIELTSFCNHKCIGCGNIFTRDLGYMRFEQWQSILENLRNDVTSLRITGGECTLHPDFEEFMVFCDSLEIPLVVFSNGRWANPDEIIKILAPRKHLQGVLISLHGHESASYSEFVVSRSFDAVLSNIQRTSDAGIKVGTNTVLTKYNIDHIDAIIELSLSLGVSSVAFSRYYGKAMPDLEPTEEQLLKAVKQVHELHQQDRRVVFNNCIPLCFLDTNIPTKSCTSGFTHCTIDPLGNVRPCTHSPYVLGSLLQQEITTIWKSSRLQEWRDLIPQDCLGCDLFNKCRGGCRATAYHQGLSQDPLMKHPLRQSSRPKRETVHIYRSAQPKLRCKLRTEQGVVYLVGTERNIAVSANALPILEALADQLTMEELYSRFGQPAIDFVGSLAMVGFVDLASENVCNSIVS